MELQTPMRRSVREPDISQMISSSASSPSPTLAVAPVNRARANVLSVLWGQSGTASLNARCDAAVLSDRAVTT